MKHWLRQYEARAIARMKRSARFFQCAGGTLHSDSDFILHALIGALHCNQKKFPSHSTWEFFGITTLFDTIRRFASKILFLNV